MLRTALKMARKRTEITGKFAAPFELFAPLQKGFENADYRPSRFSFGQSIVP